MNIKTWKERLKVSNHTGNELAFGVGPNKTSVTVLCMQAEIDELRAALAERDAFRSMRDSGVALPKPASPMSGTRQPQNLYDEDQLRDYGDRRAMAERERAAKICDERATNYLDRNARNQHSHGAGLGAAICAEAIRKGGL